jgi:predicted transposase YdaD
MGHEEGLQQGRREERHAGSREGVIIAWQKALLDALETRFGEVADAVRQRVESMQDEARLRALHKSAIQAASMEEFAQR